MTKASLSHWQKSSTDYYQDYKMALV